MKVYKIKVNGKAYEVQVEAVDEVKGSVQVEQKAAPAPSQGSQTVKAPLAGTVLDVKVSVGQQVNVGDTLIILEAMKLENEVKSQVAGTVTEIKVAKGQAVKNGDPIIILG